MRVIITRPQAEAAPWLKALDAAGYTSWSLPLIDIRPAAQVASVESVWKRLAEFDAVMFVSRNAVHYFFEQKADPAPVFTAQAAIKTVAISKAFWPRGDGGGLAGFV